jgi:hypothetical protein
MKIKIKLEHKFVEYPPLVHIEYPPLVRIKGGHICFETVAVMN